MAKKTIPKEPETKKGVWKPFLVLIKEAGLPYIAILVVIAVSLLHTRLQLIFPQATARIVAGDFSGGAIATMLAILFAQALMLAVREFVRAVARAKVTLRFRKFMVRKTLSLPVPYYDRNMADRLISRTTVDTTMLSSFFGSSIPYLPSLLVSFVGTLVILFGYDWRLVALEALIIPVVLIVTLISGRVQFTWYNRIQGRIAELTGYLSEILANIPLVKVFVKEDVEDRRGQENIDGLYKTRRSYVFFSSIVSFLTQSENLIQSLLVVVGGAFLVSEGHITLDVWVAFYLYSATLVGSMTQLLQYWEYVKQAQGAASRIAEVAVEEGEPQGGGAEMPARPEDISFEGVTFRYDKDTTLDDVSFTIPAGKVTALVGRSGAGKSTVFGLLERFYIPESGVVKLGDREAQDFDLAQWRRSIGYVPQDSGLFSGTIRENMTYGLDHEVTEDAVIQAAKDANIYDFVLSLENGFDTQVGERGGKLSGGQRQRLAIARALLKDPKILLLDEATSDLDPEAQDLVEQALDRLKAGRTTVVVTHSLSSVRGADQIILLDEGKISASGRHEELLQSSPLYQKLSDIQGGEAILGKA